MTKVLLIGESWFIHSIHQKGFDSFTTSEYAEGGAEFCQALSDHGHVVTRVPAHLVPDSVPDDVAGYDDYDVVVVSDVGANTFQLGPKTFARSEQTPDKLRILADWVQLGGGLLMVGGYMSFTGIDGKARFSESALAEVLPVSMQSVDDRIEMPAGRSIEVTPVEHPVTDGLAKTWPRILGFNRVEANADATTLARCGVDPMLIVGDAGLGRTAAFASDLAPHWAPPEFMAWEGYAPLWDNLITWLANG